MIDEYLDPVYFSPYPIDYSLVEPVLYSSLDTSSMVDVNGHLLSYTNFTYTPSDTFTEGSVMDTYIHKINIYQSYWKKEIDLHYGPMSNLKAKRIFMMI